MQITNIHKLPAPLVAAVSKVRRPVIGTLSVTELISPPQIRRLTIDYWDQLTEDASDRIWAAVGSLMHQRLENHADPALHQAERTLETTVHGINVTGTFDFYDGQGTLTDYKFVSVWTTLRGVKAEWEQQLNLYAHLLRLAGETVHTIQIVAVYRDWTQGKSYEANYPSSQVEVFRVPLWPQELAAEFLAERVVLHSTAEAGYVSECSPAERWERPTRYAVMKRGGKKALRVFDTQGQAEEFISKPDQYVEIREGASVRCESYCRVAAFCPQYAKIR